MPIIENYIAVLRDTPVGQEILTPSPLGKTKSPALDDDGIARVGAIVRPGETLVGVETPKPPDTPEEKLLELIYGEYLGQPEDSSLVFRGIRTIWSTLRLLILENSDVRRRYSGQAFLGESEPRAQKYL